MFRITRIAYLAGLMMIVFGLAFNLASPAFASSSSAQNQDPSPTLTPHWVTGCHAEPPYSKSGPAKKYVEITVDINAERGLKDHFDHDNDIWPAPPGGCPVIAEDTATPTATATEVVEVPTETPTSTATATELVEGPTETATSTATATEVVEAPTETPTSTATATEVVEAPTETSTSTSTATVPVIEATSTSTSTPTATSTNTATATSTATRRPTNTSTPTSTATEPPSVFVVNTSTTVPSRTPIATFAIFVFPNGNSPTPPPTITVAAQFIPVTGPATPTPPVLSAAAATVAPPASTEEAFLPVTGTDQTQIPALPWGNLSMLLGLCIIGATAYFDGLFSYFMGKK